MTTEEKIQWLAARGYQIIRNDEHSQIIEPVGAYDSNGYHLSGPLEKIVEQAYRHFAAAQTLARWLSTLFVLVVGVPLVAFLVWQLIRMF